MILATNPSEPFCDTLNIQPQNHLYIPGFDWVWGLYEARETFLEDSLLMEFSWLQSDEKEWDIVEFFRDVWSNLK